MTWISSVATDAQNYANQCTFAHGGAGLWSTYGQNIFASTGWVPSISEIVGNWAGESVSYNYATNTCAPGQICGHYMQVASAKSTRLGCGTKLCSINSPFGSFAPNWQIWVCNYNPLGSYGARRYLSNIGTSAHPSARPSTHPLTITTTEPTTTPTKAPTAPPTVTPTPAPTTSPTAVPTAAPTKMPSTSPTRHPTRKPTKHPTRKPTRRPSRKPTLKPTNKPTFIPSVAPTALPSLAFALTYTHTARNLVGATNRYMLPIQSVPTPRPTADFTKVLLNSALAFVMLLVGVYIYRMFTRKGAKGAPACENVHESKTAADAAVTSANPSSKSNTTSTSTNTFTNLIYPCKVEGSEGTNNMTV